ncbi:MAG: hypothetical protein AAGU14_02810 [Eubacteriaceae bacterium]
MIDVTIKDGRLYTTCACGRTYNISALYDRAKPFICPICEYEQRKERKRNNIKYNKHGIRIQNER